MKTQLQMTPSLVSRRALLLGLAFLLLASSPASAWWNSDWTIRKKITIDASAKGVAIAIADPIGGSAVLVRLHDGIFQFASAKDDGSDLRFVAADDKTPLTYHIEKYDPLLAEAFVWVKVPDLKPGAATTFWLYYGNTGSKAERQDDAKGTYDSDTALVYHFNEHGAPATDSSAGGNNAQNAGTAVDGSMIGTGLRIEGAGVIIPASPSLAWSDGAALTWLAWIKPTALTANAVIFARRDGANAFVVGCDNGVPFVEIAGPAGIQRSSAGAPVAVNSWHHLAVTAAGPEVNVYLDGVSYARLAASVPALNSVATIGGDAAGFAGEIDELQISKVARPAGFIRLAAITQGGGDQGSKLLALAADEQHTGFLSGLSGGTTAVILGSLTVDGWIVIGILMIMLGISWTVMWTKHRYLNAVQKGNAEFLEQWSHLATDLTFLDHDDMDEVRSLGGRIDTEDEGAMHNAPVYRIYHRGAEEIRHRVAGNKRTKVLSARSIQAIRASLDAVLVRETQKLNRLLVLLTIAISGGPFLGLLGTVVGVMITFAAIAAAGDVNVNAIAPGIAAALAATVAGLAVAIPALFGYNYLLTRVKNITSDMHVFIDEFVTKMAEFYGGERDETRAPVEAQLVG